MTELLVADSVTKSFGDRRILSAATLRAVSGQLRVLFGRNGIGKSTLLKIAAGVVSADQGVVRVHGVPTLTPRLAQLARCGVFFLPDYDVLSRSYTVERQLTWITRRFQGDDVTVIARSLGVERVLRAKPGQLSGGELRRCEVAAAIVRRPSILIADEPFRGISPVDAEAIGDALNAYAKTGAAVVVTGHEVELLMRCADWITWCTAGTTYELGPPNAARDHEAFKREYLMATGRGAPPRDVSSWRRPGTA